MEVWISERGTGELLTGESTFSWMTSSSGLLPLAASSSRRHRSAYSSIGPLGSEGGSHVSDTWWGPMRSGLGGGWAAGGAAEVVTRCGGPRTQPPEVHAVTA